jgi:hypothetical protein
MSRVEKPGDTVEVTTSSGHLALVQYVGDGRYRQLVRVFLLEAVDSRDLNIESLVRGSETYAIEINWRDFRKTAGVRYVNCYPIPPGKEELPPMRLFVAKSPSNPDGWKIKDCDGRNFSGNEYRALFPDVIQSSLSVTDIPMTDTFLSMLDESWTPGSNRGFLSNRIY